MWLLKLSVETSISSLHIDHIWYNNISLIFSYLNDNCIWVSAGGYDAGLIYEYELGANEPYKCTPVTEFEDTEMSCFLFV